MTFEGLKSTGTGEVSGHQANETQPSVPRNKFAVHTVRCSAPNCEAVKQNCNHWFVCTILHGKIFGCRLFMWPLEDEDRPVCGQQCAQKMFDKFLTTGSF